MDYLSFYELLNKNRLISLIWKEILLLIEEEIKEDKDIILSLFTILFSLVDDGNIAMSLDKDILLDRWNNKVNQGEILLLEKEDYCKDDFTLIRETSLDLINNHSSKINEESLSSIIGNNKLFQIEDNWLYIRKYNEARKRILSSLDRLFIDNGKEECPFDYRVCTDLPLKEGQERGIKVGFNKNVIITGGPGTGKTTSILYLLFAILKEDLSYEIHLSAPSGKASSRMKESIINGLNRVKQEFKDNNIETINKINNLKESTIHSLLQIDVNTHAFSYNKNRQFSSHSIFIIDEASMIDICLFASLLDAIPTGARLFIMGDKNQLPSVECGSVLADIIRLEKLKNHIVELTESNRFSEDTKIYHLARAVNNGEDLPINEKEWQDYDKFKIYPKDKTDPIYYYKNTKEGVKEKDIITYITSIWAKEYYSSLQEMSSNLDPDDINNLNTLFSYSEKARILCAENEGNRGVNTINEFIKKHFIDKSKKTSSLTEYAGELMMINKNNKLLDLYNGDSGILVTFKDDNQLYFMVKKSTNLVLEEGKKVDEIFKIGDFTFYPFREITLSEIDLAYAITIHKSQGSDYENILVILPSRQGHPLLNRQIIYTAITRTKGNTYILSNIDRLNEAKDRVLLRDTNIVKL